jgi:arabinofuranosyltransferase
MIAAVQARRESATARLLGFVLLAWIALVIVRNAWLSDDAYITFRSVDNFVMGRGMTWNPGQRVQSFTHPLWFFVVSAAYASTHEIYYTAIALSVVVAVSGTWLASRYLSVGIWSTLPALVALGFSRAFVDYSTSGLENAFSHMLLIAWMLCLVSARLGTSRPWFDLLTGALLLNRLDLGLLVAPTWLWVMWQRQRAGWALPKLAVYAACLAGPLLIWFAFATFYFGFPLPNTAYAKLGARLDPVTRLVQGAMYGMVLLASDPVSALLIAFGLFCAWRGEHGWLRALGLGMVLYLMYIVWIGGDFMAGRFFSVLTVTACAIVLRTRLERVTGIVAAVVLGLAGMAAPAPPVFSGVEAEGRPGAKVELQQHRVMDERRFYHKETGLMTADSERAMPSGRFRKDGEKLHGARGKVVGQIGMRAFIAGHDAVLIDPYALTDPYLARLPAVYDRANQKKWTAGHWKHGLPEGYVESVISGKNQITERKRARLYDSMQLITTGPLWSRARLQAIWRLNTGQLAALAR